MRPPLRWSIVCAAIAMAVGVRAEICATAVPSFMRFVRAPPCQWRDGIGAVRLSGPHAVYTDFFGLSQLAFDVLGRTGTPVADGKSNLHSLPFLSPAAHRGLGENSSEPEGSADGPYVRSVYVQAADTDGG